MIPPAALATITAALDDYRLTTPPDQQTPAGAAERAVEYLASSGWTLTPTPPPDGAQCPSCGTHRRPRLDGLLPAHRTRTGRPCPGSHTPTTTA